MITKVYIVRCSFCHTGLCESSDGLDHRPKYFYNLDSISLALNQAGWGIVNGMHICKKCYQETRTTLI